VLPEALRLRQRYLYTLDRKRADKIDILVERETLSTHEEGVQKITGLPSD